MSVIGIDFGNESCYVAAAKAGGIETLANDYSLRATPSCVAFDGKKRIIGVAAKAQQVTNMKNTVCGFKHLLGRKFNDPHVQRELSSIPNRVEQRSDGGIAFRVNYLDEEQLFLPEQVTAMLFTKLRETSSQALQAQVNDCVITCPIYYTNAERRALLDAAHIAGLNVLRLMNETTATALSYGFYKQDLPEDKPRNVIFVDCGHSSLQVSACAFTKGKLKMLASSWDQIGGRDFDSVLAEHFSKEFYDKYKINVKSNARAYLRLLTEVEKIKKQMSANSTKLPLNIECFMDDIDVSSSMQRPIMEELCSHLFARVDATLKKCLQDSKLSLDEIHSVEIVGGSSRIPAIKQLIEQTFAKPASTTLNQDESVSRGAALQCAIMSPAVRVREFGVTDIQNYPVKVSWEGDCNNSHAGEIEVFPAFHPAPFSRLLTLNRREPFVMTVQYAQPIPYPDTFIGKWYIRDVKPTKDGELQEIKVKVRINHHGIVLISNASIVERKEFMDESGMNEQMSTTTTGGGSEEKSQGGNEQQGPNTTGEPMEISQEANDKKKKTTKLIDLPMEVKTHGMDMVSYYSEMEAKMIANDARETQRVDARNALEEFVYDMRNKLQGGPLERYVIEQERDSICAQLNELENWLYEDGEHCDRDTYIAKLKELHAKSDPIKERSNDYENAPAAFEELKHAIQFAYNAVGEYRKGSSKYEHLLETDFINIAEAAEKAQKHYDIMRGKLSQSSRTVDSPVKLNEIKNEVQILNSLVNSIINRPKPKAPNSAGHKSSTTAGGGGGGGEQQQQPQQHNGDSDKKDSSNTTSGGEGGKSSNATDDSTMDVE